MIGFGLDTPQHQRRRTWFHHMKANAHNQKFFSPFTCFFLLHCVKTRALLHMHRHFFSPFTCVFILHRVETAVSMHTQTFFHSTPCIFLLHHMGKWNLALLCIHWHFAVYHISFFETPTCAVFLKLLNLLHAFANRWVHCFLHVLKLVVVNLLTRQLEKCLERGKLRMSSCLCMHKWLEKIFV